MARVIEHGCVSDPFANGLKQEGVLAPTLPSLMFATMQLSPLSKTDAVITIRYHSDCISFDLRHHTAKTKVFEAPVRDFLFEDDCDLATHRESFCLTISRHKTEVMVQPLPGRDMPVPFIVIKITSLKKVDTCTYLGSLPDLKLHLGQGGVQQTSNSWRIFRQTMDTCLEQARHHSEG
jgi:hypothetical protein